MGLGLSAGWVDTSRLDWVLCRWLRADVISILAAVLHDRSSLGLFKMTERASAVAAVGWLRRFARLLLLLQACSRAGLPAALNDRSKLISAIAEPLLSCLACAISGSSGVSLLAQSSQTWTLLERLRLKPGARRVRLAELAERRSAGGVAISDHGRESTGGKIRLGRGGDSVVISAWPDMDVDRRN
jgi:hypothetical protein